MECCRYGEISVTANTIAIFDSYHQIQDFADYVVAKFKTMLQFNHPNDIRFLCILTKML